MAAADRAPEGPREPQTRGAAGTQEPQQPVLCSPLVRGKAAVGHRPEGLKLRFNLARAVFPELLCAAGLGGHIVVSLSFGLAPAACGEVSRPVASEAAEPPDPSSGVTPR